jgi:hypothetical protein
MLIQSLEEMETIVNNHEELAWDGWTVVSLKPVDSGIMQKDAVFVDNKWYLQKRFELTANGWEIPTKIVG